MTRPSQAKRRRPADTPARNAGARRRLFELIEQRARAENVPITRLTREKLGMGFSYYAALKAGAGSMSGSFDFLRRCADYLGMPLAHVLMHAGVLQLEDFGTPLKIQQYADLVYFKMATDPEYAPIVPSLKEWAQLQPSIKVTVALTYEAYFRLKMALAGKVESLGVQPFESAEWLLARLSPHTRPAGKQGLPQKRA